MIRILLFTRSQKRGAQIHLPSKKRRVLTTYMLSGILMLSGIITPKAQTSEIVPNITTSGSFLGPYANTTRTYQMIIDDSQLTALSGKYLTSIAFRLPASASASWPATDATFPSYEIYLSDGVDPANRQLNFAANVVGTQTQVRSGSLMIPAGSLTTGTDPNAFSYVLTFNTPWQYNGTNLVIEIRHTGSNLTSSSIHAATTSASGYGSLFTACWQGTGNVLQGNFAFLQINSVDALGVKSVEIDLESSVYPNPAKEFLNIKSARSMAEFHIFNTSGRKIFSQKNNAETPQLNVSGLPKGNYILQMIDKDGNSQSVKFIKE
ncbi:hypothetical protein HNP38_001548 [Chryseobacterium defluvii]|uniref:Secretion system C-terminal sorting domain-containing protein n=1 Tax=Chryseobacterium defluvii TaxID=160396 RepID=A0A840KAR0_9FLAO|nr:T9SS type A sorting domain-containing protein [Chryseobacterium defluvii]MBB4806276.1 hypothetical protein [Chryseobacterium defluvii]